MSWHLEKTDKALLHTLVSLACWFIWSKRPLSVHTFWKKNLICRFSLKLCLSQSSVTPKVLWCGEIPFALIFIYIYIYIYIYIKGKHVLLPPAHLYSILLPGPVALHREYLLIFKNQNKYRAHFSCRFVFPRLKGGTLSATKGTEVMWINGLNHYLLLYLLLKKWSGSKCFLSILGKTQILVMLL